jgi:hypothetical protein
MIYITFVLSIVSIALWIISLCSRLEITESIEKMQREIDMAKENIVELKELGVIFVERKA